MCCRPAHVARSTTDHRRATTTHTDRSVRRRAHASRQPTSCHVGRHARIGPRHATVAASARHAALRKERRRTPLLPSERGGRRTGPRQEHRGTVVRRRASSNAPTPATPVRTTECLAPRNGSIRLPLSGFTYCLTLSSKSFSTVPHGTCSLSDSRRYVALDGVYHPLWAAISNNPTRRTVRNAPLSPGEAYHPLWAQPLSGGPGGQRKRASTVLYATTLGRPLDREIQRWARPSSLAVTEGVLVSFFSSAY